MKRLQMVTARWCADLVQLAAIREYVAKAGRSLHADDQAIRDLQLAVDEVCSNSIRHGYRGQDGQIEVSVVRDWGMAFDPEQIRIPDLDAPLEERSLGGLGLFLVQQVMDDVRFEFNHSKGNSVTMVRRLDREGEE
jgi:serine/threonine-protein kinase RsbW